MQLTNSFLTEQLNAAERELGIAREGLARSSARVHQLQGACETLAGLIQIQKKEIPLGEEGASQECSGPGPGDAGGDANVAAIEGGSEGL